MAHPAPQPRQQSGDGMVGSVVLVGLAAHGALAHVSRNPTLLGVLLLAVLGGLFGLLLVLQGRPAEPAPATAPRPPRRPPSMPSVESKPSTASAPVVHFLKRRPASAGDARPPGDLGQPRLRPEARAAFREPLDPTPEKAGVFKIERDAQGRVLSVQDLMRPGKPTEYAPGAVCLDGPPGMQWPAHPKRKKLLN